MRRILVAALTLTAGALTMGPLVSAAGAVRQAADKTFTVFDFEHNGFVPATGTNPRTLAPGDVIVVNGHLTLPFAEDGKFKIIGHDTGTCTLTRVGRHGGALGNCVVTAVLPHGSITTEGQIKLARHSGGNIKTAHLAITGGTGEYRGASGAMEVAPRRHFNVLTFTVR